MGRWEWRRFQAHTPNVKVFFEAVGLEQIGQLEGADIAPAMADFTLKVSDDPAQVLEGEAGTQPFIPLPLPVKAQAQGLTGQLAVQLVSGGYLLGTDVGGRHDSGLSVDSRGQ